MSEPVYVERVSEPIPSIDGVSPLFSTDYGSLYLGDCLELLGKVQAESVDTVFADPPFNVGKKYGAWKGDSRSEGDYLAWCHAWLKQCVRVLKPGGALFLYNIPKWNLPLGAHLNESLSFRHWIAVEMTTSPPVKNRLFACHYSLLYFTKGDPKTFGTTRTVWQQCRHCGKEAKDYGGYREKTLSRGILLKDVWTDVPQVSHRKFKPDQRGSVNALSTKMLDRVIRLTTNEGDVVLDPFGGSGTTYDCAEFWKRRWIGMEIEPEFADGIRDRLANATFPRHANDDWYEGDRAPSWVVESTDPKSLVERIVAEKGNSLTPEQAEILDIIRNG
jgi:site-specific DNA-methyltransferase (adenine-specific)